tara:strand:- start:117 stop:665 length:549 start_codon:yes stop_codon:yes gene_type:complete
MAHFAELDENNIVQRVLVIGNEMILDENGEEDETLGDAYLRDLLPGSGPWLQTSYNGNKRDRYAGAGMRYNPEKDRFEPTSCPLGNKSHVYDEELNWFVPPKPQPGRAWLWNEEILEWEKPIEPTWHNGWDDEKGYDLGNPDFDAYPVPCDEQGFPLEENSPPYYWNGDLGEWVLGVAFKQG